MSSERRREDAGQARTPKVSPGRPRSSAADTAVLKAAVDLFVERGFDGVGIEQVAERAGVARTTVYRRWSSKESIIAEAIAQTRGEADEKILGSSIPPQATVKGVVDALAGIVSLPRYRKMVARLIGSTPDQPELMETYLRTYFLPRRKTASETLERARAEGLVRKDADTELLLDLVSGAIIYRLFLSPGDHSQEDMRTYLRRVLRELRLEARA
jgi:AcrR family transcriptional regulator